MMTTAAEEVEPTDLLHRDAAGGTSLTFASFAAHGDLGWFSQYMDRAPWLPGSAALTRLAFAAPAARKDVARHGARRSLVERLQIAPSEAYNLWERLCGEEFADAYLLAVTASEGQRRRVRGRVRRTLLLQGKPRFCAKLTGPGRIGFLTSIFPEARFVHVIRDPRAVVDSLLRVRFWRETGRYTQPAWRGGLTDADLAAWHRYDTPEALAAVQWGAVLRTTRAEAATLRPGAYRELHYEDFVTDPVRRLRELFEFADLADDPNAHEFVAKRLRVRDLSQGWRERLPAERVGEIEQLLAGPMADLGYEPAGKANGAGPQGPASS